MKINQYFFIVVFFLGCSNNQINTDKEILLDLNRKELTKLFKGQDLYSTKGLKTKFNELDARVNSIPMKNSHILKVELKNKYYLGSREFILHSNVKYFEIYESLKWFLEERKIFWTPTKLYHINFKNKIKKSFVSIDIPTKEVLEFNGNRFLQMLSYSSFSEALEIEESEILELIDLSCYKYNYASLCIVKIFMEEFGVRLESLDAIKIIPNPLTNTLQFVIDFSYCSDAKGTITYTQYLEALNKIKPVDQDAINTIFNTHFREGKFLKKPENKNKLVEKKIKGRIELTEDLILTNIQLEVEAGTNIYLKNNAKIIVEGGVASFNGTQQAPITIIGDQENSIFFNNLDSLNFSHIIFEGLSNWVDLCKSLPSAITIYNSNVFFKSCIFSNNKRGDDMVNCFHSNFVFEDCKFKNVLSDAFDSDFSVGTVNNTLFENIGNDGVDCSGSDVKLTECEFQYIGDKAISAGEKSNIYISDNLIAESAIGFVSKDGSKLTIGENIILKNNQLDFAVFIKKPFYSNPILDFQSNISNSKYLFQKGSIINSLDTTLIFLDDVESKLYGNEFGKASK